MSDDFSLVFNDDDDVLAHSNAEGDVDDSGDDFVEGVNDDIFLGFGVEGGMNDGVGGGTVNSDTDGGFGDWSLDFGDDDFDLGFDGEGEGEGDVDDCDDDVWGGEDEGVGNNMGSASVVNNVDAGDSDSNASTVDTVNNVDSDPSENSGVTIGEYQNVLGEAPEETKKDYSSGVTPKTKRDQLGVSGDGDVGDSRRVSKYKLLNVFETTHKVDMRNTDTVYGLRGTTTSKATGKRVYNRGHNKGVLSKIEMEYYTHFSRDRLSGGRFPDEYSSLVRSNEELLSLSEKARKRTLEHFVSNGVKPGARVGAFSDNVHKSISLRDREVLNLVARLKYMSTMQISRALNVAPSYVLKLMSGLRLRRLVFCPVSPYDGQSLWALTSLGLAMSDYDVPIGTKDSISLQMVGHTTGVNNALAWIYAGTVDVLHEGDEGVFPRATRVALNGNVELGEDFVSETQIRSSFQKHRGIGDTKEQYGGVVRAAKLNKFRVWEDRVARGERVASPEFLLGNEFMWALFPNPRLGFGEHFPDGVVPRERAADGSPRSVAIEVELNAKSHDAYVKTHRAYAADKDIFGKVVWICPNRSTANRIMGAAEEEGSLLASGRLSIVSYMTDTGVFTGNRIRAIG